MARKRSKSTKPSRQTQVFPSNPRVISESARKQSSSLRYFRRLMKDSLFWTSIVSLLIIIGIVVVGADFYHNKVEQQTMAEKRQAVVADVHKWEEVIVLYPDYRDAYFKLATLEYQLGDKEKAKQYIGKAIQLDPNFTVGQKFASYLDSH